MSVKGQRKKNSGRKWSQLVNSAPRGSFITVDSVYACVHLRGGRGEWGGGHSPHLMLLG